MLPLWQCFLWDNGSIVACFPMPSLWQCFHCGMVYQLMHWHNACGICIVAPLSQWEHCHNIVTITSFFVDAYCSILQYGWSMRCNIIFSILIGRNSYIERLNWCDDFSGQSEFRYFKMSGIAVSSTSGDIACRRYQVQGRVGHEFP